jgi:glutamine synthetase
MEINLLHGHPMSLADQAFLFKRTAREAALRHKMYATFMAKPMAKEPGSAMHLHQSVVDTKTRQNIFSGPDGGPTQLFFSHIAGLQRYLPAAMSLFAPNVNSYRRVTPHNSAPINVHWGYDNRTAGLRVPMSSPAARRVENRCGGADANPYLALAAMLAGVHHGMVNKIDPGPAVVGDGYKAAAGSPYQVPGNWYAAVDALHASPIMRDYLGDTFVEMYCAVKRTEQDRFFSEVTALDYDWYLRNA